MNNVIYICSTKLNKKIISDKVFDKNESIFWLFYFSKILLTSSIPDFGELFSNNNDNLLNRYF